jgi:hypothetical protein
MQRFAHHYFPVLRAHRGFLSNGSLLGRVRQRASADDGHPRFVMTCRMNFHPAAPYAGMTQTGSMGLISAAISRHLRPLRRDLC